MALAAIAGWYLLAWIVSRPLADAPVVDSWIYARAVSAFDQTGVFRFSGFTQAMPVTQVVYGSVWGRLFGQSYPSFDVSVAVLGAVGGLMLFALALRCGAQVLPAALGSALLVCNPCYLFLSFSFMTEVPFLAFLIAAHLAFASAKGRFETLGMWLCAFLLFAGFMVRPFAAAAIAGCAGAIVLDEIGQQAAAPERLAHLAKQLAPFAAASILCAIGWLWFTVLNPEPWMLQRAEHRIAWLSDVSIIRYLRVGLVSPALYLGIVLSPLALPQVIGKHWRLTTAIGAALFALAALLIWIDSGPPVTPELSCFGGGLNSLVLRGLPNKFLWNGWDQWAMVALGSFGAAGLAAAAVRAARRLTRASVAVLLTGLVYWGGTIPLWLFNDRYDVVLVPAGCILLAIAGLSQGRAVRIFAFSLTIVLALTSLSGLYDHQRGLATVVAARDALERSGVPRTSIDAGYPLNGDELYRDFGGRPDSAKLEAGIPMVTSHQLDQYTIAGAPVAGTTIVRRLPWRVMFGLGSREIYVLRRNPTAVVNHRPGVEDSPASQSP